jgi:hypothetical protein
MVKSMAPPAHATAARSQRSALHRNQTARIALHRNQPARSALHRNQLAAQRSAAQRSATSSQRIATSSQRIASRAAQRSATLCACFVCFVEKTVLISYIYIYISLY